jgi:Tfp pilus assembly protein PilV
MVMSTPIRIKGCRRGRGGPGFTLIELMASLVVFMVTVMGLVAMQRASLGAADLARQQTAAVNIARFFMTQLKTEFANWPLDTNNTVPSGSQFKLIVGDDGGSDILIPRDTWHLVGGDTFRLDEFLGHSSLSEEGDNSAISRYCVNYMISQIENVNPAEAAAVWLVRVRVSWTKDGFFNTSGSGAWSSCTSTAVNQRITTDLSDSVVELVGTATREIAPAL